MKYFFTFSMLLVLTQSSLKAQKVLNEGVLSYNISIESVNGEKQVNSALNGALLTVYLTADKSKTEMVSTPGKESTVFDQSKKNGFILKEYSGQKLMITATDDNWSQKNQVNNNLKFETTTTTQKIGEYTCKKAVATGTDGKTYTVFFDPTIKIVNKTYNNAFPQLPGLPVQYELQSGNLIFKYTLSKYSSEAVSANRFETPKSGYRVMSYEENQQLKKGN